MTAALVAVMAVTLGVADAGPNQTDQLRNLSGVPQAERNPVAREKVWPAEVGQGHVCLWAGDKVAAFSVTIDDNTKPDHHWWLEQGEKYGFRFTWFVITGRLVEGQNPGFMGTWADFQRLVDAGHDVQSHAVSHRSKIANLSADDDYGPAVAQINENIKGVRCLTMAYPGGGLPNDPKVAAKYYIGCRGTRGLVNGPSPDYMDTCSIGTPASAFIEPGERGSWATLIGVAEKHPKAEKNYRNWYCMHFHGVAWIEKARNTIAPDVIKVLDYVKQREDKFWVALFREVMLYGQERDTAKLTVTKVEPAEMRFTLTDRMLDDWFDFPLTIKVRVPNEWSGVLATQADEAVGAALVEHKGNKYALVQAAPDKGEVIVRATSAP